MKNEKNIISVSRRTDIPAFHNDWFFEKLKQGYVEVKNPFNPNQIRNVSLKKEDVLGFVFWTKNPEKMIGKLNLLKDYFYYFLFTLNPYQKDIETNVPEKTKIIDAFKKLSDLIGRKKVIWRYDPILLSEKYDQNYHFEQFDNLANKLHHHTEKCIISFLDLYRKTKRKTKHLNLKEVSENEKIEIAGKFFEIAKKYDLKIQSCAEKIDFTEVGIAPGKCIDDELISEISRQPLDVRKDRNQRKECKCVQSIDIGDYNTCLHHCLYCYAD